MPFYSRSSCRILYTVRTGYHAYGRVCVSASQFSYWTKRVPSPFVTGWTTERVWRQDHTTQAWPLRHI